MKLLEWRRIFRGISTGCCGTPTTGTCGSTAPSNLKSSKEIKAPFLVKV
jgi:hypothetical protein